MKPLDIIQSAAKDGVCLSLSDDGLLNYSGNTLMVKKWLPVLRENKPAIIKAMLESSACTGDLEAIRKWLTFISEYDPSIINEVLDNCRTDADARAYFKSRAKEIPK
jgi:hypothetical protein